MESTILGLLVDALKDLFLKRSVDIQNLRVRFFNEKINRYYQLFNDVHNDYVNSFNQYINDIEKQDNIDENYLQELFSKINNDIRGSYRKREYLKLLNVQRNIEQKPQKVEKLYELSKEFINSINDYLYFNASKELETFISIPFPQYVDVALKVYSYDDYDQKLLCSNVGRRVLKEELRETYELFSEIEYKMKKSEYIKKSMIKTIRYRIAYLEKNYLKVQLAYEKLSDVFL